MPPGVILICLSNFFQQTNPEATLNISHILQKELKIFIKNQALSAVYTKTAKLLK